MARLLKIVCLFVFVVALVESSCAERLRLIIETDAGGDPDDEQSLIRFLLYANEWDIEGIIANRAEARHGENRNPERTGLGILRRQLNAYGDCWANLVQHDRRFPTKRFLWDRAVAGYNHTEEAVNLIIAAVDRADPRPVWYSDWGTDHGAATNNLRRALDRVLRERGQRGYAEFKSKLRLSSATAFGEHIAEVEPPFPLWVNTFEPELDRKRWYHRFSALTATAGGFDLVRDVLTGHGALGALYPTNTNHRQKEGDTMTFLYLVPIGMNNPEQPGWGSWAGRYGPNEKFSGKPYYWANQLDTWNGTTNRDNTLGRWAVALQNDFRARLDWCVKSFDAANHPPIVRLDGIRERSAEPGTVIDLNAEQSTDPDGDKLSFKWEVYSEVGTYKGPVQIEKMDEPRARLLVPQAEEGETIHIILTVTDNGTPALSRYGRLILQVRSTERGSLRQGVVQ